MIGLESGCVFCNPIAPLVTSGNFCPLKYGVFHGIPVKDSGGATIEDTQVVGCKKNQNLRQDQCRKKYV